jgi:hypothetical protein
LTDTFLLFARIFSLDALTLLYRLLWAECKSPAEAHKGVPINKSRLTRVKTLIFSLVSSSLHHLPLPHLI